MKYQISDKIIFSADMYAEKSWNHTHGWDGFKNDAVSKRKERISTGKIAEYWMAEYCHKRGIKYKLDSSSFTENDDVDILINGWDVDCKSSVSLMYSCQVQPSHDAGNKSQSQDSYYCFFYVDRKNKNIQPIGFIEKEWLQDVSNKVFTGEQIRGGIKQKHKPYSYFIRDSNSLIEFNKHMEFLSEYSPPKRESNDFGLEFYNEMIGDK